MINKFKIKKFFSCILAFFCISIMRSEVIHASDRPVYLTYEYSMFTVTYFFKNNQELLCNLDGSPIYEISPKINANNQNLQLLEPEDKILGLIRNAANIYLDMLQHDINQGIPLQQILLNIGNYLVPPEYSSDCMSSPEDL